MGQYKLTTRINIWSLILFCSLHSSFIPTVIAQHNNSKFNVIAFYSAREDLAHISFDHEANKWFSVMATKYHFRYDSTKDWNNLNAAFLSHYQVVLFLDVRPDSTVQRDAFKHYMDNGGAWMGFHFAGFALTPSDFPQNWDWYHNQFLGAGEFNPFCSRGVFKC